MAKNYLLTLDDKSLLLVKGGSAIIPQKGQVVKLKEPFEHEKVIVKVQETNATTLTNEKP